MGQSASNAARKVTRSVSSVFSSPTEEKQEPTIAIGRFAVTPYVFKRTGSMYFDEDGDLAHEFYIEVKDGQRYILKRSTENLTPEQYESSCYILDDHKIIVKKSNPEKTAPLWDD